MQLLAKTHKRIAVKHEGPERVPGSWKCGRGAHAFDLWIWLVELGRQVDVVVTKTAQWTLEETEAQNAQEGMAVAVWHQGACRAWIPA